MAAADPAQRSYLSPAVIGGAGGLAGLFILLAMLLPGAAGWLPLAGLAILGLLYGLVTRPDWGVYLALILLPLSPILASLPLPLAAIAGPGFYFYVVVIICLLGTLVRPIAHRQAQPITHLVFAFSAIVLVSTIANCWRFTSSGHLDYLASGLKGVLSGFLAYMLVVRVTHRMEQVRAMVIATLAISMPVSLLGIAQGLGLHLGLDLGPITPLLLSRLSFDFRVNATFDDAAFLAIYYLVIVPVALALAFGNSGLGKSVKAMLLAVVVLALPPFVLAFNKSSYLALLPALLFLVVARRSRSLFVALGIGAVGFTFLVIQSGLSTMLWLMATELGQAEDVTLRLQQWQLSLQALVSEPHIPFIGAGPYGNRIIFGDLLLAARSIQGFHSHSEILELLTNYGLIGAVVFLILLYRIFRIAYDLPTTDPFLAALRQGFLASFLALAAQAIVFPIFTFLPIFWVMAGLVVRAGDLARVRNGNR